MSAEFKTENAALETEIADASIYLGADPHFVRAFESGDTAEMGRLLYRVICMNRVTNQQEKTCHE